MPTVQDTAYPRLKGTVSPHDLATVYTLTWEEVALANGATKGASARVCFLVYLKTYQRLGYSVPVADVPASIVEHIARSVGVFSDN